MNHLLMEPALESFVDRLGFVDLIAPPPPPPRPPGGAPPQGAKGMLGKGKDRA